MLVVDSYKLTTLFTNIAFILDNQILHYPINATCVYSSTDWEEHASSPCIQIKKVIDKYSMIADGLSAVHDSMRDIREGYQTTKRTMQQGVDSLKNDIDMTGK